MEIESINKIITDIKSGANKQFVFDLENQKVKCRCGKPAVFIRGGYLCASITARPCKFN